MANSNWVETIGVDPAPIMDEIVAKGINKYDAAALINNLIAINLGQAPRHFSFSQALPAASDVCTPKFAREFSHQDWVDGESVVQASESADDKGFNWRFNAIVDDLDHLNADTKTLFSCLNNLRAALVQALQDVAAELNRIDTDLAGLSPRVKPETPWKWAVVDSPQFLGTRDLDGSKVTLWQHDQNVLVLPAVDTVGLTTTIDQHINTGPAMVNYTAGTANFVTDVGKGMTASQLIAKYGSDPIGDGRTVADVLAVLPPDSTYKDTTALIDSITSWEQGYIRSTVGSIDAISTVTGVTSEGAPISRTAATYLAGAVTNAPENLQASLVASGLNTNDVAAMSEKDLTAALGKAGVKVTSTQSTQLLVAAKTAVALAGRG